jgi:hypothetical protein
MQKKKFPLTSYWIFYCNCWSEHNVTIKIVPFNGFLGGAEGSKQPAYVAIDPFV